MAFLVLAFPTINKEDFEWIQSYRVKNDKLLCDVVDPHFTIVFPVTDMTEKDFVDEVTLQAKNLSPIDFEIDSAIVNKDLLSDSYYEFLVPREGNNEIIKLHDKLYSQKLSPNLRSDIEFIPHITIGKSKSMEVSKNNIEQSAVPMIIGKIEKLSIVNYQDNVVSTIETAPLFSKGF